MIEKQSSRLNIGLIVNAFAGIGGEAALKGSDGHDIKAQAMDYHGQKLRTPERVRRFLTALLATKHNETDSFENIQWFTGFGVLGEHYFDSTAAKVRIVEISNASAAELREPGFMSHAQHTKALCIALLEQPIDILVFSGGDGTARDVFDIVGKQLPCLGLPSGVKMQSGVFAITPEAAAEVIKGLLHGELVSVCEQDVRDIDELALRQGRVRSQYYGELLVPSEPRYIQQMKQGSIEDDAWVHDDIAHELERIMQESMNDNYPLMLIGPGRTTAHFMQSLTLTNTLVGFDAVINGRLIQNDLTAKDLLALQQKYKQLRLVISPTGQQGMLIGRGNQQLTPAFLSQLQSHQWLIVASKAKLKSLAGRALLVDSNDVKLDRQLCGLYRVIMGLNDSVLYPVNTCYES